ncbi:hypothetical protein DRE_00221 [Drechslerella stenobrocha 248]|uniref:Uncharacterized protein n=1 Tax=Drechslerella stenobrocha 248 TaxID=1043628 RepID=W7HXI4_9PEZI|nr:hypothetical protein DRE_00221 [Drechslerella stenobrocha 248]
MLSAPRPVPPAFATPLSGTTTTHPRTRHAPRQGDGLDDEDDDDYDYDNYNYNYSYNYNYDYDGRPSISDDRFYLPVCSPVVTSQPPPLPTLSEIPGNFPSSKDVDDPEAKPAKRTSPLTVVQTGIFYFFSCGWCGMTETSKRVRKEAKVANKSLRERWMYEIENRPKALRKLIKTTADNVETNIVPSIMARVSHHYHYYTGTEPSTTSKSKEVMSMSSSDTYAPHVYSRWRGREVVRPREGSQAAPPIQNFAEATSATYVMNNDLMWMMEPPPAPVWKSDGRQGPRLALAEEDEMAQEKIRPRLVSKPTTPARPKPTIMRISTLPSIESLASRVAEEQERDKNLPRAPPAAALLPSTSSQINRVISRPQPLFHQHSRDDLLHIYSPTAPPFSAPARSLSWDAATATPRSSSDRVFTSYGSDGTSSPTTIHSTTPVPRLRSPSLTKAALAPRDENGNPEAIFLPRRSYITSDGSSSINLLNISVSNILEKHAGRKDVDPVDIPVPGTPGPDESSVESPLQGSPRSTRRRSIPLTALRV